MTRAYCPKCAEPDCDGANGLPCSAEDDVVDPKPAGLAAWLPTTASEDSFFGIDHGTYLSEGVVYDGNAFAAALKDAFDAFARDTGGGIPETLLMSKRAYDIMRLGYDPDGRFARKYRRRQAKRRLKHAGKAWV